MSPQRPELPRHTWMPVKPVDPEVAEIMLRMAGNSIFRRQEIENFIAAQAQAAERGWMEDWGFQARSLGCNYWAFSNLLCNKCGRQHDLETLPLEDGHE